MIMTIFDDLLNVAFSYKVNYMICENHLQSSKVKVILIQDKPLCHVHKMFFTEVYNRCGQE